MKNLVIFLIVLLSGSCKVIDDPINTGICENDKTKTMWEYFITDTRNNWSMVTEAIEYAGIKHIFDGSDTQYKELTFLGVTNLSIKKFLYENELEGISDLSPEEVKAMLLSHIVMGKIMKEDCDYEVKGTNEGGKIVTSLTGKEIRIYRIKTPGTYGPESGAEFLAIHALESGFMVNVASADIEVKNGVVHALTYGYTWTEL